MSKLCIKNIHRRWFATKLNIRLNENVATALENNEMFHKHHPGRIRPTHIAIPKWIREAISNITKDTDHSLKKLRVDTQYLKQVLFKRHPPKEQQEVQQKIKCIRQSLGYGYFKDDKNFVDDKEILKNPNVRRSIKDYICLWVPIQYNSYNGLLYLFARGLPDYASLCRIFNEIHLKDPDFQPTTLFDFGSGIGSVLWAASAFWSKSLKEHVCIDVSTDMTTLSADIIKYANPAIRGVFYRHFMPATPFPTFDIVVSAYSLLDLPSAAERLQMVLKLWQKTERYLVIVELGTSAGFRVVHEARDFLLYRSKERRRKNQDDNDIHVFLPCPHDLDCPKFLESNNPCNFTISHESLRGMTTKGYQHVQFSYVVLKKEKRPEQPCLPRIVGPVHKHKKVVHCRMCTSSGKIVEPIITTKKYGRHVYRCARVSKWGDSLPVSIEKVAYDTEDSTIKSSKDPEQDILLKEKGEEGDDHELEYEDEREELEDEDTEEEYERETETDVESSSLVNSKSTAKTEDTIK